MSTTSTNKKTTTANEQRNNYFEKEKNIKNERYKRNRYM